MIDPETQTLVEAVERGAIRRPKDAVQIVRDAIVEQIADVRRSLAMVERPGKLPEHERLAVVARGRELLRDCTELLHRIATNAN